jgi:hypothetical protein
MLAAVVISFFLCLLPFRAFTLWIILVPSDTIISLLSSEKGKICLVLLLKAFKAKLLDDDVDGLIYSYRH